MPALTDTLAHLHAQSHQIVELSNTNYKPPGPFTETVLRSHDILSLIRDADPSEERLFKFVGEESSGNKHIEKRDGGLVTPLKELKREGGASGGEKGDNVLAILRTAMTLVDDYRSMPRAKNHVRELMEAHQAQAERVAELERLIQEATDAASQPTSTPATSKPQTQPKPVLSIDEAIKAEGAAIKRLDAHIAPHRQTISSTPAAAPPIGSSSLATSPSPPRHAPAGSRTPAKTPISKTPNKNIHIANSLVNGATPRRIQQPINRFSPLKLIGTPRSVRRPSALRPGLNGDSDDDNDDEELGGHRQPKTIFSRASILRNSTSSLKRSANRPNAEEPVDNDDTVRIPRHDQAVESPIKSSRDTAESAVLAKSPEKPIEPEVASHDDPAVDVDTTPQASPVKQTPPTPVAAGPRKVEGVEVESDFVTKSTSKLYSMWSEILHQGLKPNDQPVQNDPEAIVKHLYKISQSDPDVSPSDTVSESSISTATTIPTTQTTPITSSTILLAHLLLMILRSSTDGSVSLQTSKETLGSIARARGWECDDTWITKLIYVGVGKRVIKIERKPVGGRISFIL